MGREYKSFEDLRNQVFNKYAAFAAVSRDYLNDEGKFMHDVYDALDDCFRFTGTNEELVVVIRDEIVELRNPVWYRSPEVADRNKKVAEKLRKYVRWNIEKKLWENIPEFANRKDN